VRFFFNPFCVLFKWFKYNFHFHLRSIEYSNSIQDNVLSSKPGSKFIFHHPEYPDGKSVKKKELNNSLEVFF